MKSRSGMRRRALQGGLLATAAISLHVGWVTAHAIGDPLGLVNVDPNGIVYTDDGTCPKADVEITLDTGCYQGKVVSVSVLQGQAVSPGGVAVSGNGPANGTVALSVLNAQAYGTAVAIGVLGDAGGSGYANSIYQCSSPAYASQVAVAGMGTACGSAIAISGGGRSSDPGRETRAWSPNGVAASVKDPTQGGAAAVSGSNAASATGDDSVAVSGVGGGNASAGMVAVSLTGDAYACNGPVTFSESLMDSHNQNPGCPGSVPLPIGSLNAAGAYAS